jgi:flagellin
MSVVIGTNVPALLAAHHLSTSRKDLTASMTRLASGQRINSAADDAGSIGVASSLMAKVKGSRMALQNVSSGLAAISLADSALSEVESLLQRARELKVQSLSTGTYSTTDIGIMNDEIDQIASEIGQLTTDIKWNGAAISTSFVIAKDSEGGTTTYTLPTFLTSGAIASGSSVANIDAALVSNAEHRGSLGAYINRLNATKNNLSTVAANAEAGYSAVMDTDYAYESAQVAKGQILQQAGAAILAQANASTQYVLTILQ